METRIGKNSSPTSLLTAYLSFSINTDLSFLSSSSLSAPLSSYFLYYSLSVSLTFIYYPHTFHPSFLSFLTSLLFHPMKRTGNDSGLVHGGEGKLQLEKRHSWLFQENEEPLPSRGVSTLQEMFQNELILLGFIYTVTSVITKRAHKKRETLILCCNKSLCICERQIISKRSI